MNEADICNFVNDDLDLVSHNLEMDANKAIDWFKNNEMIANPQKVSTHVFGKK